MAQHRVDIYTVDKEKTSFILDAENPEEVLTQIYSGSDRFVHIDDNRGTTCSIKVEHITKVTVVQYVSPTEKSVRVRTF